MYPDETLALDAALGWGVNASTKFGGTAPFFLLITIVELPEASGVTLADR